MARVKELEREARQESIVERALCDSVFSRFLNPLSGTMQTKGMCKWPLRRAKKRAALEALELA